MPYVRTGLKLETFENYALNAEFVDAVGMLRKMIKSPFESLDNFRTDRLFTFVAEKKTLTF